MKKEKFIFNNQRVQRMFSLFLSFLLVFPHLFVVAEAQEVLSESTEGAVTVTIEDHTTGEIILEPTRVLDEDVAQDNMIYNVSRTFEQEGGEVDYGIDWSSPVFDSIVKSVILPNDKEIKNDGENKWDFFLNSKKYDDIDEPKINNDENQVIRLIYSSKNEDQIGIDGDTLQVNKDQLITKLGLLKKIDKETDEIKEIHKKGLNLLLQRDLTAEKVDEFSEELNEALNPVIPATDITISSQNTELVIGEAIDLTAEVLPENATGEVEWTSENPYIASVDENGKVIGQEAGTTKIQAKIDEVIDTVEIFVREVTAEELEFEEEAVTISQGSNEQLKVIVKPENTTDTLRFTSEDEEIAEVDSRGVVVGKLPGKTKIYATVGELTAKIMVTVEERGEYTEPTVVFEFSDGRVLEANAKNEFALSPIDEGNFVLKGAEDIEFIDGQPYWDARQKITEGTVSRTNSWIAANGTYQPHEPSLVEATVSTNSPNTGASEVIQSFKIKAIPTEIVELKGYVDGQELQPDAVFSLDGSESKNIEMKGRVKGSDSFISLPTQAFSYKEIGQGNGYINNGKFGMNTGYDLPEDAEAPYQIQLLDGQSTFNFTATTKKIGVSKFEVSVPKVAYIDDWNNLAGQYVGVLPYLSINPENATNARLNWEALTPEIAEYLPLHNNGIVPKKAGQAKFLVTSEDNPSLTQEVALEFKYKNPVILASISEEEFVLEQYEDVELPIQIAPENATEQRFDWSFSKENIVDVEQKMYQENTSNVNSPVITSHTLVAKNVGTVRVTGTPIDDTAGAKPIQFNVRVTPSMTEENVEYLDLAKKNKEHGLNYLKTRSLSAYGDEWNLFALLRSGETVSKEARAKYVQNIIETLNSSARLVPTDYARIILALEAGGYDAREIGGHNLVELLYANENLENYPANHFMWTLIGLDTKAYKIPDHAEWTREKTIQKILTYQTADGGFGLSKEDKSGSVDMTAMGIQALAPYYENSLRTNVADDISDTLKKEVNEAMEQAVHYLSEEITSDAGFIAHGAENSNSVAQVLTALSSIQLDVTTHEDFNFGKKNMLTNIEKFKVDEGYAYMENQKVNEMATVQVAYSLNAFERFITGEKSLYDFTDTESGAETGKPGDSEEADKDQGGSPTQPNDHPGNKPSVNEKESATDSDLFEKEVGSNEDTSEEQEKENQILPKTGSKEASLGLSLLLISSGSVLYVFRKKKEKIS